MAVGLIRTALDTTEAPPTASEQSLLRDARLVDSHEEAQSIAEKTEEAKYQNGAEEAKEKVDKAVEEVEGKKATGVKEGGEKKGWLAGWRG